MSNRKFSAPNRVPNRTEARTAIPMKLRPVSEDHLKINAPRWKLVQGFFKPDLNPVSISVAAIVLLIVLFLGLNLYPKQSTRDYGAAAVSTRDLEFSDMELAAYDGLRLSISYRTSNGSGVYNRSSKTGGIIVRGSIKNTSSNEFFLLAGARTRTLAGKSSDDDSLSTGNTEWNRAEFRIEDSIYSKNYKQIPGYIIKPDEKFNFELITANQETEDLDRFELEIEWPMMEFGSLSERLVWPVFTFEPTGSSRVWGEATVYWGLPIPVYRAEWARSP